MSIVARDQMTELRTADESYQTSLVAEDEIQLKAVAYEINTAANSGATRTVYQGKLRPAVLDQITASGYKVTYLKSATPEGQVLISWKPEDTNGD